MAEPNLDEFNTTTRVEIMPTLADGFFKSGPVVAYTKENRMKEFQGGTKIQENFVFKPMKGGFYQKGGKFDITRQQTRAGMQFDMKKAWVNVTEFLEDIEIELRSPHAAFDVVRADLADAALTMSAILEIAAWQHGQDLSGVGGENRVAAFNGIGEALNDGVNASWDGNIYTSYGGQIRSDVNGALTPPTGLVATPAVTTMTNRVLEHSYQSCIIGKEHPKLAVTTNRCVGFINELYAGMQRLQDTVEPVIGWPGLKFKQATIIESQYAPGRDGVNDPDIGNYLASGGEVFAWLNPLEEGDDAGFRLWISASPKFQFGFTGFKVGRDDTMVSGQILFSGNLVFRAIRLMRVLHGITS